MDVLLHVVYECWSVLGEMSPYLLFGFLVAGVLSVCFSPAFVERHLGGRGFMPIFKAAMLGIPLPLCSCGVIPVSASFRRHGASRGATVSFLLSTPETGVDSISVTYALLGPIFAIVRPLIALLGGLMGGTLIMLFDRQEDDSAKGYSEPKPCTESCCANPKRRNVVVRVLEYGFVTLPRDIGPALLLGVLIAGVISAVVQPNELQPYLGGGFLSLVIAMAIGIPLYVCASASVPIAVGLIHLGASPGTALAFLIAGPATNAATITMIWRLLGRRAALLYLATIAISAVAGGWTLDLLSSSMPDFLHSCTAEHVHETMAGPWSTAFWAILLLAVLAFSYFAKKQAEAAEAMLESDLGEIEEGPRQRLELSITGMTCGHCAEAVAQALRHCGGVESVQVDLKAGRAVVVGESLNVELLIATVAAAGYRAAAAGPISFE